MSFPRKEVLGRARRLRRESTPAERVLWERLCDRRLRGLKFRRQVPIGPYVADFYCHALRLVVELDGGIHEGSTQGAHDKNRDANLHALGYTVLRFANEQILQSPQSVLSTITGLADLVFPPPLPLGEEGRGGEGRDAGAREEG